MNYIRESSLEQKFTLIRKGLRYFYKINQTYIENIWKFYPDRSNNQKPSVIAKIIVSIANTYIRIMNIRNNPHQFQNLKASIDDWLSLLILVSNDYPVLLKDIDLKYGIKETKHNKPKEVKGCR